MFSANSFQHVSLMALALAARRIAAGIMHGEVSVTPLEDPDHYFGGGAHPERGYILECRGETVAEVVEFDGRHWASWDVQYGAEGAEAFESALTAEADAAHAVAETIRSLESDGCAIDAAGVNVVGQGVGNEPTAWLEYEDEGGRRPHGLPEHLPPEKAGRAYRLRCGLGPDAAHGPARGRRRLCGPPHGGPAPGRRGEQLPSERGGDHGKSLFLWGAVSNPGRGSPALGAGQGPVAGNGSPGAAGTAAAGEAPAAEGIGIYTVRLFFPPFRDILKTIRTERAGSK